MTHPSTHHHARRRRAGRRHAARGDAVRVRQGTPLVEAHRRGGISSAFRPKKELHLGEGGALRLIDEGGYPAHFALAAKIGRDQNYVANIIGMVQISPKIIHAVIRGGLPEKPDAGDAQEEVLRPLERAGGTSPRRELAPHRERTQDIPVVASLTCPVAASAKADRVAAVRLSDYPLRSRLP